MKTDEVGELAIGTVTGRGVGRVFISYDRRNQAAVTVLADELEALGHQVWFDRDVTGGHRWWESILSEIRACTVFMFALTPESLESRACKRELEYACQLNREVLPVLLSGDVAESLLPRRLAEIQYVDYRRQDRQSAFALIRAVSSLPASPPLPNPLPEPPAPPSSYLGDLKERIDSTTELKLDEQIAIVFKLREEVRAGRAAEEARGLLRRMRERDDLRAKVATEIEAALGRLDAPVAAPEAVGAAAPAERVSSAEPRFADNEATWGGVIPPQSAAIAQDFDRAPAVAAVLSIFIPGLGQFYNREIKKGLVMLIAALVVGGATHGMGWFAAAIWSAIDAYNAARRAVASDQR